MSNGDAGGRTTMAIRVKGTHFPQEVMLMGVRWYLAYPPDKEVGR
jgi:transposase-like protein